MRACPQADRAKVAALVALRDRLDPFAVAARIDRKLERVYALALTGKEAYSTSLRSWSPGHDQHDQVLLLALMRMPVE